MHKTPGRQLATSRLTLCAMWAAAAITYCIVDQRPVALPDQALPGDRSGTVGLGHAA